MDDARFELATSSMSRKYSTAEIIIHKIGGSSKIRTWFSQLKRLDFTVKVYNPCLAVRLGIEPSSFFVNSEAPTPCLLSDNKFWYRIRVTIPSSHLERVMTSPEVECDIK